MMESQRVVVVVEETEASRTALKWAIRNFIRGGDSITLLHVYPSTRSEKRQKSLRLMGFQLALSFKDLCNGIAEAKVEILVKEGDLAQILVSLVNKVEASTLVVGLHDQSFLCKTLSNFDHNVMHVRAENPISVLPLSDVEEIKEEKNDKASMRDLLSAISLNHFSFSGMLVELEAREKAEKYGLIG